MKSRSILRLAATAAVVIAIAAGSLAEETEGKDAGDAVRKIDEESVDAKEVLLPEPTQALQKKYQAALEQVRAPLSQLKSSYAAKLQELKKRVQATGHLQNTLLVNQEIERIATKEPGSGSEFESLADLQCTYHEHFSKISPQAYRNLSRVEKTYVDALVDQISAFTKNGKLGHALAAKTERDNAQARLAEWTKLSAMRQGSDDPIDHLDWEKLGELIQSGRLQQTGTVGGIPSRGDTTPDIPEEPSIIVGFDLYMAPFGGSRSTVRKMVPLFRTRDTPLVEGLPRAKAGGDRRRILGKKGYVVAGISTHSEAGVRKVKLRFEKVNGLKTTMTDAYETEWYGKWDGGRTATLHTDGKLPVGVDGWVGQGTGETWLIVADP